MAVKAPVTVPELVSASIPPSAPVRVSVPELSMSPVIVPSAVRLAAFTTSPVSVPSVVRLPALIAKPPVAARLAVACTVRSPVPSTVTVVTVALSPARSTVARVALSSTTTSSAAAGAAPGTTGPGITQLVASVKLVSVAPVQVKVSARPAWAWSETSAVVARTSRRAACPLRSRLAPTGCALETPPNVILLMERPRKTIGCTQPDQRGLPVKLD